MTDNHGKPETVPNIIEIVLPEYAITILGGMSGIVNFVGVPRMSPWFHSRSFGVAFLSRFECGFLSS